jgi:hypothetical protein
MLNTRIKENKESIKMSSFTLTETNKTPETNFDATYFYWISFSVDTYTPIGQGFLVLPTASLNHDAPYTTTKPIESFEDIEKLKAHLQEHLSRGGVAVTILNIMLLSMEYKE